MLITEWVAIISSFEVTAGSGEITVAFATQRPAFAPHLSLRHFHIDRTLIPSQFVRTRRSTQKRDETNSRLSRTMYLRRHSSLFLHFPALRTCYHIPVHRRLGPVAQLISAPGTFRVTHRFFKAWLRPIDLALFTVSGLLARPICFRFILDGFGSFITHSGTGDPDCSSTFPILRESSEDGLPILFNQTLTTSEMVHLRW